MMGMKFVAAYKLRAIRYPVQTAPEVKANLQQAVPAKWRGEFIPEDNKKRGQTFFCKV